MVTMESSFDLKKSELLIPVLPLLLSSLFLFACKRDKGSESDPPVKDKLEILWRTPILSNLNYSTAIAMNPIPFNQYVVASTDRELNGFQTPILFLDSATGAVQHYWSDFIDGSAYLRDETYSIEGNYLLLSTQSSIDCVNLKTQQTQWQSMVPGNSPFNYSHNGFVYTGIDLNGGNSAAIIRSPVDHLSWDTVYHFTRTDRYDPNFESMGFGSLENGDAVLVWKNRSFSSGSDRTDIFAFNLSADTLLWRNMDLHEISGIMPLLIDDEAVFGTVRSKAFSIDLATGMMNWTRDFEGIVSRPDQANFTFGSMCLTKDALVLKGTERELVLLNKNNGGLRNVNPNLPPGVENRFTQYDNKLFLSTGHLVIIDDLLGDVLNDPLKTEALGWITSGITIDSTRGVMYFHNGREVFCARIPENL